MAIRVVNDPNNFYKALKNADGSDILITVPQYFTKHGISELLYERTVERCGYVYVPKGYGISVNISSILPQLEACWRGMTRPRTNLHVSNLRLFKTPQFDTCQFMHADGSPAEEKELH